MPRSTASQTLEAARLFAAQAAAAPGGEPAFRYNLEAAIVFGRSVTFHVQKEFAKHPAFEAWYASQQIALAASPVCAFFLEKRNFVLKEGRLNFSFTLQVESVSIASSFADVELKVIRGAPWYRRPLRTLWEDLIRPVRERWRKQAVARLRKQRIAQVARPRVSGPPVIGFVDFKPAEAALVVLEEYFAFLERVVSDAEERFTR